MFELSKLWNQSIEQREKREYSRSERPRIWASELGKSDIDIYLKLHDEPMTNEPDARAIRKFEAGNLFEWIIELILMRCGVMTQTQDWINNKEFGLEVTGKLDFMAGGHKIVKTAQMMSSIQDLHLPGLFTKASDAIIEHFEKKYPDGLPKQGIEVKSTSSFGIEKVYFTGKALAGHDLQAFHYAYNTNTPFMLLYICRDDLRMAELPILPDNKDLLKRYKEKIESVTKYFNEEKEPEREPPLVFDEDTEKFSKNFNVEYSAYLKRNYGFDNPDAFNERYGKVSESFNRVITRIKEGKPMTDNNKEKIEQMEKEYGFNVEEYANKQRIASEGGDTAKAEAGDEAR